MNRYARPENFGHKIRTPLLRTHYVYRAFNAAHELLYVGCTHDVSTRLNDHRFNSKRWFKDAVRITLAGPFNYETAREVERVAIATERSLFNYTPERRAIAKAHGAIYAREWYAAIALGLDPLREQLEEVAQRWVRYPGNNSAFRIKDGDVLAAKRADAEHARLMAGAA